MRRAQDWRGPNAVVIPEQSEVIGATLWHRRTYTSGVTTRLTFFDVVPADKRIGNLNIAGQLPAGVQFRVQAIRIKAHTQPQAIAAPAGAVDPLTGPANDLFLIYEESVFTLDILNKRYAEYPSYLLPPGSGPTHNAFSAGAAGSLGEVAGYGEASPRAVFTLAMPIVIPPQTNFTTVIEWPAGFVTLAGGNTDITVLLDGQLMRPVQ